MPKPSLKNPFARRRSSGNVLDTVDAATEAPVQSSFRVIERPEKNKIVFDGSDRFSHRSSQVPRPFSSPLQQLKGKSVDDLSYHANGSVDTAASRKAASALKHGRSSGITTGSGGSSDIYQSSSASARHSSSSTLPSSVDPEAEAAHDEDELFPTKRTAPIPHHLKPLPIPTPDEESFLPPPPSFSARAQRAFSFGLRSKQAQEAATADVPVAPAKPPTSHSPTRERALTTSSYASTAVPTKIDLKPELTSSDFGGDFGKMFERPSSTSPVHRTDSEPLFPPRSYNRQSATPSPRLRRNVESPFDRRNSRDGLLGSAAPSPDIPQGPGFFLDTNGYSRVSNTTSPFISARASLDDKLEADEVPDDGVKRYQLRDSQEEASSPPFTKSHTLPALPVYADTTPVLSTASNNPWERESTSVTPRADRNSMVREDEPLFDSSPIGPASRAKRPDVLHAQTEPVTTRRLTKAQFDILQQYAKSTDDKEGDSGGEYDDDDDVERAKQLVQQRRKQEANMAIYRQQMLKSTGGGPTDLPVRPGLESRSTSTPVLHVGGMPTAPPPTDIYKGKQTDDEDDDVPLGILQAHGFPSSNRPPTRSENYTPPSSAAQRNSQIPVFARRLPEDPYFGAGIVQPTHRESLAFGSAGSVYGGYSAPSTPGGLMGRIVEEEERKRALRRSPNQQAGYSTPLPPMNRTSSMASLQAPQWHPAMAGMPQMPPMPQPNDPAMQDFMRMQMQFMANMQAMMLQQTQMQPQQVATPQSGLARPVSTVSNILGVPGAPTGGWNNVASRPQSTLDPRMSTIAPSMSGLPTGYTPSIAPSERSNVGMPSRYRPVQNTDAEGRSNSLTSSLTLNAFSNQPSAGRPASQFVAAPKSTIRVIEKPKGASKSAVKQTSMDDEEGDWGDLLKKRTKRADRVSKSGGDRVPLSELYPNVEL